MATAPMVGFLVPLNSNFEEESTVPKIPISTGINYVGRNCIPVIDKRLSRKHVAIHSCADGSADIFVEGTNPIVLQSKNERNKLLSGEKWKLQSGDVIELIPGHYLFKYISIANKKQESGTNKEKRPLNGERNSDNTHAHCNKKKSRQDAQKFNGEELCDSSRSGLNFQILEDTLPSTFRLLRTRGLPDWANSNAVSINDVIQGDVLVAILSNYMVDIDWLLSACPMLRRVPHVLVIHGEGDGTLEYMKRNKPSNWILHKPPLPISYGTHHSKAMLLVYPRGVRVSVHTANLIHVDWNNKTQGLWMQDFPWKNQNSTSSAHGFESDLIDYLSALKWPEFNASFPTIGNFCINASFFKKFDYKSAVVRLIASVPGYHSGSSIRKWGHMKIRTVLQQCTFDQMFEKSPLVYQFSSLGSLDEKWMSELAFSMSAGMTEDQKPLGLGKPSIIWPTVENIRNSLEVIPRTSYISTPYLGVKFDEIDQGYAAGNAVPSPLKNVEKEFLKKYWSKWKATHTGRCRAMPHIKTFTRYNGQNLAWFLLTSSNLSKAAWGALQKNNSQLMIRSYELGVLFLPPSGKYRCGFSCTDNGNNSGDKSTSEKNSELTKTKLITLMAPQGNQDGECAEIIKLPVPYELPPQPYSSEDVPWSWDRRYTEKDVCGQVWPRQVKLYASQDF